MVHVSIGTSHTEGYGGNTHALGTGVVVAIGGARYTHSTLRAWQLEHFGREPSHCGRATSALSRVSQRTIPDRVQLSSCMSPPPTRSLPGSGSTWAWSGLTLDFLLLQAPHATGILRRFCGRCRAGDPPGDPHESSSAPAALSLSGRETRMEPAMISFVFRGIRSAARLLCRGWQTLDRSGKRLVAEISSEP